MTESYDHFEGKSGIAHVVEHQVQGIISASEIHGAEMPGHLSSGADAAKDTAFILAVASLFIFSLAHLAIFALILVLWKGIRASLLGWARLERLHRLVDEERSEIEHHREQERQELIDLYQAKGFEGKLLEQVVDVLMSDNDRLLRVMLQEEMGLALELYEHPLKQGVGAAAGALLSVFFCLGASYLPIPYPLMTGALTAIAIAAGCAAKYEKNEVLPAVIWNCGAAVVVVGSTHSLIEFLG